MELRAHPGSDEKTSLKWIAGVWLLAMGVLLLIVGPIREAATRRDGLRAAAIVHDPAKDPQVGAPLPMPQTDYQGGRIEYPQAQDAKILYVAAGSCSGCSLNSFDPSTVADTRFDLVLVIYDGPIGETERKRLSSPPPVRIVADVSGSVSRRLNAMWWPRFFVTDGKGNLIAIQKNRYATLEA